MPDIRIALIEDNLAEAILTTEFFTDLGAGYDVSVGRFLEIPPIGVFADFDGVVVDYELKGAELNGLQLCALIGASYPKMPLALFTGFPEEVLHVSGNVLLLSKHDDVDAAYKIRRWYAGIRSLQDALQDKATVARLGQMFQRTDRRGEAEVDVGLRRRAEDH